MRAVTWQGRRDVRVETVPDPRIQQPNDAIIQVTERASAVLFDIDGTLVDSIAGHE